MHDATTLPPMPDTKCPSWCQRDHAMSWLGQWELLSQSHPVKYADGTVHYTTPITPEALAVDFLDGLAHSRPLYEAALTDNHWAGLALERDDDEGTHLWLDAQGPLTAAQARSLADGLQAAADKLEEVSQ